MMLSARSRYAVMALVELARHEEETPVPLAEIAHSQDIAVPYLEQIFNQLRQQGLVLSVRGPKGGYRLGRKAQGLPISDIIHAVDEPMKMTRCSAATSKSGGCTAGKARCRTHHLWEGLEKQIENYLASISLADVAGGELKKISF